MLSHSISRFYIVTKFILETKEDIKIKPDTFHMHRGYFNTKLFIRVYAVKLNPNMKNCAKVPYVN